MWNSLKLSCGKREQITVVYFDSVKHFLLKLNHVEEKCALTLRDMGILGNKCVQGYTPSDLLTLTGKMGIQPIVPVKRIKCAAYKNDEHSVDGP